MRHVGPADVIDGHARAMHRDALDIARPERMPRLHGADRVQRGVVAADAGIEFQRDPRRLPALPQPGDQFGPVEAVERAGEGGAEAAIFVFEHVDDAGEAAGGEQRAI